MRSTASQIRNYLLQLPMMLLMILGLACPALYAQGNGTIVGTVTDPSGAVIPNAKITITNLDNGFIRTTVSNSTGSYSAPELAPGHYAVRVEAKGFKTYERKDLTLHVSNTVRADISLQVGEVGQSVTVEADAIQVQADTSDISQTITSNQIENLGTNGRNVLQLAALVPGASSNMPDFDSPAAQFQNRSLYFNGMRQDANNWQIDGGEAYDRGGGGIFLVSPSQDAIAEFTTQTSNYAADEGESSGGMTSMELKSGTKQFHASAWEYDRNDALDAYTYFSKHVPNPKKPELRYNAFGFNAGGPVEFKSSNPKTFFFYNMEWRREIQGGSINNVVPTSDEFAGNESANGRIWVPMTTDTNAINKFAADGLNPGDEFPNDTIPANLIDANAAAYIKAGVVLPPNSTDGKHYFSSANTNTFYREEIARMDEQFNEKLHLMGHFIWDSSTQQAARVAWTGNTYPTIGSLETVPSWTGVIRLSYSIRPNLLNEIAYDENGNNITIGNSGITKAPSGWAPTPLFSDVNVTGKLPRVNVGGGNVGFAMDTGSWPWQNWWRSNQIKDDLSWIHGAHNMKFGFAYMFTNKKQQIFVNTAGSYDFNGSATGCGAANPTSAKCPVNNKGVVGSNGVGLADFLLGDADNYNQPELQDAVSITNLAPDAYAADDWRIAKRLTLNLGLRWESLPHAYDTNNRLGNFYPNLYNPADAPEFLDSSSGAMNTSGPGFTTVSGIKLSNVPFYMNGVGLAGRNGIPRGLVDNHIANFAPRVGFALDMFGNGNTILRGGVGIFYERNAGNEEYNMGPDPPFSNNSSTHDPYLDTPTVSWVNGDSAGKAPTTPQGFTGVQKTLPISATYQFNLGIQHQFRSNMVGTLGFVGNTSSHLSQTVDINTLRASDITDRTNVCGSPCGGPSPGYNANYYRQYLGFAGINLVEDEGNAHYESLQATFRASAWKNLSLDANYTYSHAFDIIDGQLFNNIADPMNPGYSNGTSGFDRRHIAALNFNYNLPIFRNSGAATRRLLGGWIISGVGSMVSGNPITIGAPNWLGFGSGTSNRADLPGKVNQPGTVSEYFDPTSFTLPAPLQWGNSPKAAMKGLGEDHWNLSLYKDFHFTERSGFQFRADAFNAWNHSTFNSIDTNVFTGSTDPTKIYRGTAGEINNTGDAREFQFGAKIYY